MAKKTETVVTLTDDIDGGRADRTVGFSFDGQDYEIELSKKNATALQKALAPYIEAGRKVRGGGRARSNSRSRSRADVGAVREWAKANGHEVSDRGRISQEIRDAYDAAN